jgi:hypothetical protein
MKIGDGTYNLSSYTIQAGDEFKVGFWAKTWDNVTTASLTATLFYGTDPAANAIGSFAATLTYGRTAASYVYYESSPIAATAGSVGQQLGIRMVNTGTGGFANFDEVTVAVVNATAASDPDPQPVNIDGTVGALVGTDAQVTLNFKAGRDPNSTTAYPVYPEIVTHYVWIGTDSGTLTLDGSVNQVHNADPNLTDPANAYGPVTLSNNTLYYWQVEEGLDNGTGNAYAAGDPNNIMGPVWSFTTVAAIPIITTQPRPCVADESGNGSFSISASATATHYRWTKAGMGELVDGGIYSGSQTDTLTITGAAVTDEGAYYCIAYNGDPDAGGTPSAPSNAEWLVTHRLVGYWKLDGDMTDSVATEVPGAIAHDGVMNSGDPNYLDESNSLSGTAMRFFNDGQFMELPDADFFNFYEDGFTIIYWYKQYANAGWRLPMSKFDLGTRGWLFGHSGNNPNTRFIVETFGGPYLGVMTDGQWNMATVTYDPVTDTLTAYSNGDQNAQNTVDLSALPLPAAKVLIGGAGTDAIDAAIDEVRMYSYPLTSTEIATLYTDTVSDTYICVEGLEGFENYDLNHDCRINLADFALVASQWLECQRIPTAACTW